MFRAPLENQDENQVHRPFAQHLKSEMGPNESVEDSSPSPSSDLMKLTTSALGKRVNEYMRSRTNAKIH